MTKLEESGFARRAEGLSRRDLVRAIGISAGGIALGVTSLGGASRAFAASASFGPASQLSLELDGGATPVFSAEGGNAFAEVNPDGPPSEGFQRKHTGAVKYEDLILQFSLVSAKALSGWISQAIAVGPGGL